MPKDSEVLAMIGDLVRTIPRAQAFTDRTLESVQWRGKAIAVVTAWDARRAVALRSHIDSAGSTFTQIRDIAISDMLALLYEAQHSLAMQAGATGSFVVEKGSGLRLLRRDAEDCRPGAL